MRQTGRIVTDEYVDVQYEQFAPSSALRIGMRLVGYLLWPVVLPLAFAARVSNAVFRTMSELLALVPYVPGTVLRYEFYRWTLRRCGTNVVIGFGTVLLYRDVEIGDHVLIGMYTTIHHCDFGSYVVAAEGCRFLSGSRYHSFGRTDIPMALQGGKLRRIRIGDDCWIGADAIVMNEVGPGSIVGAGSVVTAPVEPATIVAGNPARVIRRRS
jgi:acetyltransferase-like isoleucine patch superfamily enzyme